MSVVDRVSSQEVVSDGLAVAGPAGTPRGAGARMTPIALPSSGNQPFMRLSASKPANRWSIVTIIAAMVVISFAILYESKNAPSTGQSGSRESIDAQRRLPLTLVGTDAVATDPSRSVVAPSPEIVDVVSDQPLIGDGRKRELYVSLSAARGDIESVESRFIEGDAALRSPVNVIDVSRALANETRLPAGLVGLKTARPLRAIFEFIVVLSDGTRSQPFRKELTIAPMPATAPTIVTIASPENVVAGQAFRIAVVVLDGDAKLAAIERTVVDAAGFGPPRTRTFAANLSSGPERETMVLPVAPPKSAHPITIALTPIDARGRRGPEKRIVVAVAATALSTPAVMTVRAHASADRSTNSNGSPSARPNARGAPDATCTRSTCGSIVLVRDLDGGDVGSRAHPVAGERRYEVLLRTDDRAIHAFREPRLLRTGTRARVFDGKLLASFNPPTTHPIRREARSVPDSAPFVDP